ncbi:GTP-binding protein [Variovorax ureilyticus]|uniref:GTP-binding protein n=1 Tax=Variovorax ureilyticus TaxID=1836198 RepID=A0ABU8VM73_9BURK
MNGPGRDTRVPVHVLTGFLGSGKTTLLRHMLADPDLSDTAVVINEFGEVGLDHLLVRAVAEDVVLLSSGCLCCSVRDDLVSTLAELNAMMRTGDIPAFARVVVETTGMADPAPIMQAILSEQRLTPWFRLGQVITTVDAVNGDQTLVRHREARQQLATADRVILTKPDLVDESDCAALLEKLRTFNPGAAFATASKGRLTAGAILDDGQGQHDQEDQWRRAGSILPPASKGPGDNRPLGPLLSHHDEAIRTFTVQLERPVEWSVFVDWLELLLANRGDSILRVKGLLGVTDDERPVVVQGVQHVLYPIDRLPTWPKGTSSPGWIVFIARDLTARAIENSLRSVYEFSLA